MNRKLLSAITLSTTLALPALAAETDPTRPIDYKPAATETGQRSDLTLQSLLISKQRKRAVINGRRVTEGDRIGGAKVVAISTGGVIIERNGKRRTLKINNSSVKRATGADD